MKNALKYFFYRLYQVSLSNGEKDPGWSMTIVSMFLISNIYSIIGLILVTTNSRMPQIGNLNVMIICGLVLYSNYVMLIKNNKPQLIIKQFQHETGTKRSVKMILVYFYVVVSICFFIYIGGKVRGIGG